LPFVFADARPLGGLAELQRVCDADRSRLAAMLTTQLGVCAPTLRLAPALPALGALHESEVAYRGWLYKEGGWVPTWRWRLFVLLHSGRLCYFRTDRPSETAAGCIDLAQCDLPRLPRVGFHFELPLHGGGRAYLLRAADGRELGDWLAAIGCAQARCADAALQAAEAEDDEDRASSRERSPTLPRGSRGHSAALRRPGVFTSRRVRDAMPVIRSLLGANAVSVDEEARAFAFLPPPSGLPARGPMGVEFVHTPRKQSAARYPAAAPRPTPAAEPPGVTLPLGGGAVEPAFLPLSGSDVGGNPGKTNAIVVDNREE